MFSIKGLQFFVSSFLYKFSSNLTYLCSQKTYSTTVPRKTAKSWSATLGSRKWKTTITLWRRLAALLAMLVRENRSLLTDSLFGHRSSILCWWNWLGLSFTCLFLKKWLELYRFNRLIHDFDLRLARRSVEFRGQKSTGCFLNKVWVVWSVCVVWARANDFPFSHKEVNR